MQSRKEIEAKSFHLLKYAFESWGAVRVEIITTTDHLRSQKAIERLGATREGVLRKKYNTKDYVFYSIIDEEWERVRQRLERLLSGDGYAK